MDPFISFYSTESHFHMPLKQQLVLQFKTWLTLYPLQLWQRENEHEWDAGSRGILFISPSFSMTWFHVGLWALVSQGIPFWINKGGKYFRKMKRRRGKKTNKQTKTPWTWRYGKNKKDTKMKKKIVSWFTCGILMESRAVF